MISKQVDGCSVLLVQDDVWTEEQAAAYAGIAAACGRVARMLTTRDHRLAVLPGAAAAHKLPPMGDAEARVLLAHHCTLPMPDGAVSRVLNACRGSPAMVRSLAKLCELRGVDGALANLDRWKSSGQMEHLRREMPGASDEYGAFYASLEATLC